MKPLDKITIDRAVADPRQKNPLPTLRQGEVVEGWFVKSISSTRAILMIRGRKLVARLTSPIGAHGAAHFRVEKVAPECVLRLVPAGVKEAQYPRSLTEAADTAINAYRALADWIRALVKASKTDSVPDGVSRLWKLAERVALKADKPINSHHLKEAISRSGMTWEWQLRGAVCDGRPETALLDVLMENDVKAMALKTISEGEAGGFRSLNRVARFVNALEQLQLANLSGLQESGVLSWIIPVLQQGRLGFVRLLAGLPGKRGRNGATGRKGLSVCLLLEMSQLGPVRIEAVLDGTRLGLRFVVGREAAEKTLRHNMQELTKRLETKGFSLTSVSYKAEREGTDEATSFPTRPMGFEDHDICVVA